MSAFEIIVIVLLVIIFLSVIWLITEINALKNNVPKNSGTNSETIKLQLQAYERLAMLSERISLPNLVGRIPNAGLSSKQMQAALVEAIKSEYEYNVSQQVYVSPEVWRAVNNLKEQNIYIINQIGSMLPVQASGMDLNKHIIDHLLNNPASSLHNLVLEALNFEAKKLM